MACGAFRVQDRRDLTVVRRRRRATCPGDEGGGCDRDRDRDRQAPRQQHGVAHRPNVSETRNVGSVPRWVLVVIGVVILVAALDVAVFVAARSHSEAAVVPPQRNGTVAVIDPRSGHVLSRIPVGREPTLVAAGFGGVWVL